VLVYPILTCGSLDLSITLTCAWLNCDLYNG
jgi:hypothetical protein